jgi:CRP/FNR family transcriptional regulator
MRIPRGPGPDRRQAATKQPARAAVSRAAKSSRARRRARSLAPRDAHGRRKLETGLRRLGWPESSIARLLAASEIGTFPRARTIYTEGSPATRLYWMLDGVAKLSVEGLHGRRVLVALAKPGALLGSHLIVSGRRMDTAVALTEVRTAAIDLPTFQSIAYDLPPGLIQGMTRRTLEVFSRTFLRTVKLLTLDLRGKLALSLADLADGFGVPDAEGRLIKVRLTHEDLSELAGVSRARVTKMLRVFADHGLVHRRGRDLVVDAAALRALGGG